MPITLHHSIAVHPGDWLKTEIVEPHGITVTEAAGLLRVSRQALSALLNGRADLSPDMAIRFEKVFGIDADTMLRMQLRWDVRQVREREAGIVVERSLVAA